MTVTLKDFENLPDVLKSADWYIKVDPKYKIVEACLWQVNQTTKNLSGVINYVYEFVFIEVVTGAVYNTLSNIKDRALIHLYFHNMPINIIDVSKFVLTRNLDFSSNFVLNHLITANK